MTTNIESLWHDLEQLAQDDPATRNLMNWYRYDRGPAMTPVRDGSKAIEMLLQMAVFSTRERLRTTMQILELLRAKTTPPIIVVPGTTLADDLRAARYFRHLQDHPIIRTDIGGIRWYIDGADNPTEQPGDMLAAILNEALSKEKD